MGSETRSISEVIDSDLAEISRLGFSVELIASRMLEITKKAIPGLGNLIDIDDKRKVQVDEAKGWLVCPWPHPGRFAKRVTTVRLIETNRTIKWSDLNIHLIAEHGFFEGKGAGFRLEPRYLVEMIF